MLNKNVINTEQVIVIKSKHITLYIFLSITILEEFKENLIYHANLQIC